MKKNYLISLILSVLFSTYALAQISTETFETEINDSKKFTDNGVVFNILSHTGTFYIQGGYPTTGWNGSAKDHKYIDNSGYGNVVSGASFSLKTTSNLFNVRGFWIFLGNIGLFQNVTGSLTITGKLSGVSIFTTTKTSGFNTSYNPYNNSGINNGYTFIDLTNLNGQNFSNIVIDQLQLTLGGEYTYAGLDAFNWIKDSGVLAIEEPDIKKNIGSIYPNPTTGLFTLKTEYKGKIFIYEQTGKLIKSSNVEKGHNQIDISEWPKGIYIVRSQSESYKIIKN